MSARPSDQNEYRELRVLTQSEADWNTQQARERAKRDARRSRYLAIFAIVTSLLSVAMSLLSLAMRHHWLGL